MTTQDRPAGGCVVLDLTGPMHTEASEALRTGDRSRPLGLTCLWSQRSHEIYETTLNER